MLYRFNNFEFDSENFILTHQGKTIDIRHNEAKLLAFLISHPDRVLSKEEILSSVWQDKIVSEQAVFQNMSHLRNLLGNHAIKTFPKRGYQWQLDCETVAPNYRKMTPETTESSKSTEPTESTESTKSTILNGPTKRTDQTEEIPAPSVAATHQKSRWGYAAIISIIIVFVASYLLQNNGVKQEQVPEIEIAYFTVSNLPVANLPTSNFETSKFKAEENFGLQNTALLNFIPLERIDPSRFLTSIELEYQSVKAQHPFVLGVEIRFFENNYYLDFLLKGPFASWQGQLSGTSIDEANNKLQKHLTQPFIYELLSQATSPELKLAKLSIAHQESPQDLINLVELIKIYIAIGELDKAMVIAEKLAKNANTVSNVQQEANAFLQQSRILTMRGLYQSSAHLLDSARKKFEVIGDLKRQADAMYANSWLDHNKGDYPAVKQSLLKASALAFQANDKKRELEALTYLSIMAFKNKQEHEQYYYLQQAENKMKAYELPSYHFAKIPFHYAIFAKTSSDKEPHFEKVLEFTALTPDHWVAQSSRLSLLEHYIEQQRIDEARELVEQALTDNAQNSYLKTLLAQAEEKTEVFVSLAQKTFEQAQLSGNLELSLDIALILCNEPLARNTHSFYSQYIDENAPPDWRARNQVRLLALNI